MADILLDIRDLSVVYATEDGVVRALNKATLQLHKGETLGLVGETGAGKTTLARGIMRLVPQPPGKITSGEVIYDGTDLLKLPEREMRQLRGRQISMIFQDPMTSLNPVMTVGHQIQEVITTHHPHLSKDEARKQAEEMLEMVGISASRYDDYPHQFSGGMKQRVVIAIALACNPQLLIADEPTTALDVTIQAGSGDDSRPKAEEQHGHVAHHPRSGRGGPELRQRGYHLRRRSGRIRYAAAGVQADYASLYRGPVQLRAKP